MIRTILIALGVFVTGAAPAQDDIMKKAINQPGLNYNVTGAAQTTKRVKDSGVVGGQALRVQVTEKGPENYSVQAISPLTKPIVKGHRIVVAIWARAPRLTGNATTPIPFFGVIGPAPGYAAVAGGPAQVGTSWKLYDVKGVAPSDFAADAATVVVHLAGAKAVIDLGPVFVIDLDAA